MDASIIVPSAIVSARCTSATDGTPKRVSFGVADASFPLHRLSHGTALAGTGASATGAAAPTNEELEPVKSLVVCAQTCKKWRPTALRALIVLLSPPASHWTRANAARAVLGFLESTVARADAAESVLRMNGVAPLLRLIQIATRGEDMMPLPSKNTPAVLAMSDNGLLCLAQFCALAEQRLLDAGWEIEDDESSNVRFVPLKAGCGKLTRHNPLLAASWLAEDPEGRWPSVLLQQMPKLISPQWDASKQTVWWPCQIRDHVPANGLCQTSADDLTVLDETSGGAEGCDGEGVPVIMRQLVLGCWRGLDWFRESEYDLAESPGTELYNWYTTALAAAAVATTRGHGRVLVVGLGGGSIVSFLRRHCPALKISALDNSPSVVDAATKYFGLECSIATSSADCPNFTEKPNGKDKLAVDTLPCATINDEAWALFSSDDDEEDISQQVRGKQVSSEEAAVGPVLVHTIDALEFVRRRAAAMERASSPEQAAQLQFDAIIIDVFTRGVFPSNLLVAEFWDKTRLVCPPPSKTSSTRIWSIISRSFVPSQLLCGNDNSTRTAGVIAINCGGHNEHNGGYETVLGHLTAGWPAVQIILEDCGEPATDSEGRQILLPGSLVVINGLNSTAGQHLNGRRATILFWAADAMRYGVRVEASVDQVASKKRIKPMNLKLLQPPPDSEDKGTDNAVLIGFQSAEAAPAFFLPRAFAHSAEIALQMGGRQLPFEIGAYKKVPCSPELSAAGVAATRVGFAEFGTTDMDVTDEHSDMSQHESRSEYTEYNF